MIILVNCTTLRVGGGLFAGVNFVTEAIKSKFNNIEWYYLLSSPVYMELLKNRIVLPNDRYLVLDDFPSSLISYYKISSQILKFEKAINPDIIYSVGSPSYITFVNTEVQRLTNPWVTHPNIWAISTLSFFEALKELSKVFIQRQILSNSKYFITQTNTAKNGILSLTNTNPCNVKVISNCLSPIYQNISNSHISSERKYIFCLAAPYPHKNLLSIPKVASILREIYDEDFCFLITVPFGHNLEKSIQKLTAKLGVEYHVENLGLLDQSACATWYRKSSAVFLPTYLETFSVTLLESIYFNLPVITTNFNFNKDVSGDTGLYFNPGDWLSAAKLLKKAITDQSLARLHIIKSYSDFCDQYGDFHDSFSEVINFLKFVNSKL
jgi:glycosyltransferase involved in cell wall biosynthesis